MRGENGKISQGEKEKQRQREKRLHMRENKKEEGEKRGCFPVICEGLFNEKIISQLPAVGPVCA